jgi:hypothetical protein
MVEPVISAATLPGDVYAGRTDPMSEEGRQRAIDLAGFLTGGGMPMAEEGAIGIFGGRGAAAPPLEGLRIAQKFAKGPAGDPSMPPLGHLQGWQKGGWYQGADAKWRFEIPDDTAQIKTDNLHGAYISPEGDLYPSHVNDQIYSSTMHDAGNLWVQDTAGPRLVASPLTVRDVIDHPQLFDQYPHIAAMRVHARVPENAGAVFNYGEYSKKGQLITNGSIGINPQTLTGGNPNEIKSLLLHEMQHAVQQHEGFALGANTAMESLSPGLPASAIYANEVAKAVGKPVHQLTQADLGTLSTDQMNILAEYALRDAYWRSAGEVESRNVQARMGFSPAERQGMAPWESQDVRVPKLIQYGRPVPFRRGGRAGMADGGDPEEADPATDWRNDNGQNYLAGLRSLRPDVQRRSAELLATLGPRISAIEDAFAKEKGWTPNPGTRVWERNPAYKPFQKDLKARGVEPGVPPRPWDPEFGKQPFDPELMRKRGGRIANHARKAYSGDAVKDALNLARQRMTHGTPS